MEISDPTMYQLTGKTKNKREKKDWETENRLRCQLNIDSNGNMHGSDQLP
jgi:hypothetical protein